LMIGMKRAYRPDKSFSEPVARNTAPRLRTSRLLIERDNPDAVCIFRMTTSSPTSRVLKALQKVHSPFAASGINMGC